MKTIAYFLCLIPCVAWGQMSEVKIADAAINGALAIKERLKKPESFEVTRVVYIAPTTLCYEYKARNSFNDVGHDVYVVTDKVSSDKPKDWNKICANKSGTDYTSMVRRYTK